MASVLGLVADLETGFVHLARVINPVDPSDITTADLVEVAYNTYVPQAIAGVTPPFDDALGRQVVEADRLTFQPTDALAPDFAVAVVVTDNVALFDPAHEVWFTELLANQFDFEDEFDRLTYILRYGYDPSGWFGDSVIGV